MVKLENDDGVDFVATGRGDGDFHLVGASIEAHVAACQDGGAGHFVCRPVQDVEVYLVVTMRGHAVIARQEGTAARGVDFLMPPTEAAAVMLTGRAAISFAGCGRQGAGNGVMERAK